jgi:hypothetical protein
MKLFGAQRRRKTTKPLQFLELVKTTFDCDGNTRQQSAVVRHHEGNSLDPRNDDFLKLIMQSSHFFKRDATGLFVSYDLLHEEAIKKTRCLNIPQSYFNASKGWAIWFTRRMGLALRHRMTICQKKCCMSNALDISKDVIVWEDDALYKDDSDWVESVDNDLVMSDDSKSDE